MNIMNEQCLDLLVFWLGKFRSVVVAVSSLLFLLPQKISQDPAGPMKRLICCTTSRGVHVLQDMIKMVVAIWSLLRGDGYVGDAGTLYFE